MKPMFKEFTFRLAYAFILALINLIYVYLSYGVQLEYFSSLFTYAYQSPDFCYGADFSSFGTHASDKAYLEHTSLSWKGLSVSNLLHFYNVQPKSQVYDLGVKVYVVSTFVAFAVQQACAFALPGVFSAGRGFLMLGAVLNLGLPTCACICSLGWACFKAELGFEMDDSELFGSAWAVNF